MVEVVIEKGIRGRIEETVSPDQSAARVGSGLVDVFATPMMIALVERTCHESVLPHLADGQGTVGTKVEISHTAATPVGMRVWCESELTEADRRRLVFSVKVYDECGMIGEGEHERFVVDMERFQQKAEAKKACVGGL